MTNESHHAHILPIKTYIVTLLALLVLMGLTVAAGEHSFANDFPKNPALGSLLNNFVALTIAVIKASLVVMFFMHVKYGTKLVKLYAALGFLWVGLIGFMTIDYMTRNLEPVPTWNTVDKGSALPRANTEPMGSSTSSSTADPTVNISPRF